MQKIGDPQKEIQAFIDSVNTNVLVGYLDGKKHEQTLHKDDTQRPNEKRRGNYTGYDSADPTHETMDNSELAKILTFGSATIPARPFIEEGLLFKKDELKKEIGKQLDALKDGKPANWNKVGTKAVGAVQEFVRSDYYKSHIPNSQKTIEYKGSDTPLIDGGDLINSLEYVLEIK